MAAISYHFPLSNLLTIRSHTGFEMKNGILISEIHIIHVPLYVCVHSAEPFINSTVQCRLDPSVLISVISSFEWWVHPHHLGDSVCDYWSLNKYVLQTKPYVCHTVWTSRWLWCYCFKNLHHDNYYSFFIVTVWS